MKCKLIDKFEEIPTEEWDRLLKESRTANIFQSPAYYKFWGALPIYQPFIFAALDEREHLKILLSGVIQKEKNPVKGFLSRRAIVYGGPLIDTSASDAEVYLSAVLKFANQHLKKNAIYSEIRNSVDYSAYKHAFEAAGWKFAEHLNFIVDCTDAELLKKRMSNSKIRQVKKSLKAGAQIEVSDDPDKVARFYSILHDLYRTKVKKPLPPREFFLKFSQAKLGHYLLVTRQDQVIGGIMCPVLDNRVLYEWFVCGEDGQYDGIYPSVLATWAAMDYASQHYIRSFDFMGAGKPDQDYGVREFKSKFGGELVQHGRYKKVNQPLLYQIGALGIKLLSKL